MPRYLPVLISCLLLPVLAGQGGEPSKQPPVKFVPIDIIIDSANAPMAAYQVLVKYDAAKIIIVGVEGGSPNGFGQAPFFDQLGLQGGRIIIGAFVAQDNLATMGKVRVARLHLRVIGDNPEIAAITSIQVMTAIGPGGKLLPVKAELVLAVN